MEFLDRFSDCQLLKKDVDVGRNIET